MLISCDRTASRSSPSNSRMSVPPRADEKVFESSWTASTSWYLETTQKPGPFASSCQ